MTRKCPVHFSSFVAVCFSSNFSNTCFSFHFWAFFISCSFLFISVHLHSFVVHVFLFICIFHFSLLFHAFMFCSIFHAFRSAAIVFESQFWLRASCSQPLCCHASRVVGLLGTNMTKFYTNSSKVSKALSKGSTSFFFGTVAEQYRLHLFNWVFVVVFCEVFCP